MAADGGEIPDADADDADDDGDDAAEARRRKT